MRVTVHFNFDDEDRKLVLDYWRSRLGDKRRRKNGLANADDMRDFVKESVDNHWIEVSDELNKPAWPGIREEDE